MVIVENAPPGADLVGRIVLVRITGALAYDLTGELVTAD
jgi:hypothetical protein